MIELLPPNAYLLPKNFTNPADIFQTLLDFFSYSNIIDIEQLEINTVKSSIFMWSDIQQNRPVENKMVAILNDNRKIANGALEAFINYDAIPICWSKRNSSIDSLRIA